jgi:uncharacterized LabA/DUF88 family protein
VDRCALFVDASYMLADGAMAVYGTRNRESVSWDYTGVIQFLGNIARDRTGVPLLRCYWYEATVEGRRTAEHEALADLPGVKLRLNRLRPGRREGVDSEIRRDMTTLARNGAVSDALVVSAEEDLVQVITEVQDFGMRVTIVHIPIEGNWTISRGLRQECDGLLEISEAHLRPYVQLRAGAEPGRGGDRYALPGYRPPAAGNGHGPVGHLGHVPALPGAPAALYQVPAVTEQQVPQPQNSSPVPGSDYYSGPTPAAQAGRREAQYPGVQAAGQMPTAQAPDMPAAPGHDAVSAHLVVNQSQPLHPQFTVGQQPPAAAQPLPGQDVSTHPGMPVPQGGHPQHATQAGMQHSQPLATGPQPPAASPPGHQVPAGQFGQQPVAYPAPPAGASGHLGAHTMGQPGPPGAFPPAQGSPSHAGPVAAGGQQPGYPATGRPPAAGQGAHGHASMAQQSQPPAAGAATAHYTQPGAVQMPQQAAGRPGPQSPAPGQPAMPGPAASSGQPSQGPGRGPGVQPSGGFPAQPPQGARAGMPPQNPQQMYAAPPPAGSGFPPAGPAGQPSVSAHQAGGQIPVGQVVSNGAGGPAAPLPPMPQAGFPGQAQPGQYAGPGRFGPGPQDQRFPGPGGAGPGGAHGPAYVPPPGPYSGPQPATGHAAPMPPPVAMALPDAVQAAHGEGFQFGQVVARDAPALWLEAVLARKPRMPSDLEARLLQDSSLPIDSLLHDEVRHALRRGFWDALERTRH